MAKNRQGFDGSHREHSDENRCLPCGVVVEKRNKRKVDVKSLSDNIAGGHVRYINILTWLRGFRVKDVNVLSFFCLSIPKRDLDTKKTTPNIEICLESIRALLEY